ASAVALLAAADWRLALLILFWFACYAVVLRVFLPQMRERSRYMSEMRSNLTGCIVDSYTNILTVKLFARARDEDIFVRDSIDKPRQMADLPEAADLPPVAGAIRFERVSFDYGRTPRRGGVLRGLDLDIAPGERVGLVGRSGAGKSTLVHLLLGFYRPETGHILIDGIDITGLTQESLRAQIGMVTQDTSLLHRSIRDNIRYGRS